MRVGRIASSIKTDGMSRVMKTSIALVCLLALFVCGQAAGAPPADAALRDGAGAPRALPNPAIILFWAAWCAPCRVEVQMLPELTRAADPTPVIVIPMETGRTTRELLGAIRPDQLRFVPGGAYRLLGTLAGDTAGLPVSVAIDPAGAVCAVKQGAITVAEIGAWARKCGKVGR
jgi:thiol-disulfide isomerase/thioredoxin